jgi:uncharacterized protein (DUF1800 family)
MSENTTVLEKKRVRPVVAGLTPYSGTFGREQVIHLLKRTMFGAKRADIDFFAGKTLAQTLDVLMTPAPTPVNPPLRNYTDNARCISTPPERAYCELPVAGSATGDQTPIGATWVNNQENGTLSGERTRSLKAWWVGQMVNQNRSIHEKMVLFWHNHFSTEIVDTTPKTAYFFQEVMRRNALGNLKTLVLDVTFEPNMLIYLNGRANIKTAPDENYGRELQELFTVGKGPNSKYTEDDVKAAARVLTGWGYSNVESPVGSGKFTTQVTFNANNHDTGTKQFSAFYANKLITASTGTANTQANALREFNEMLDMIFATQEVAFFISRKLYRHFVYYDIDATVEADVIAPMAQLIKSNNYDIAPALKALLSSEHFFEIGQKACVIKSPLDFLVGAAREFDIEFPTVVTPTTDVLLQYGAWMQIANNAALQGQNIGDPPNVAGWPAYYQEPIYHETWINTDTFPKRLRVTDTLLTTAGINLGSGKKLWIDAVKFTDGFGDAIAGDPNKLIDAALELLYRVPPTAAMRTYLKTTILLGGQASDYYWTDAWNAYKNAPTNTMNLNIVTTRLQAFYKFLIQNPEYQLS